MLRKKPSAFLVLLVALLFLIIFTCGIYLIDYLLYPRMLDVWKTYLISITGSLGISLAILSGLAQITGYSIKDLFSPPIPSNQENEDNTMMEVKKQTRTTIHSDEIKNIIDEVQSILYSDNQKMPVVLTKCLILAELVNLHQEDKEWLSRELNGYQYLTEQYSESKYLRDGVELSASHRIIEPYIKMQYVDAETHLPEIMTLPVQKVFISYPISQIIEEIRSAKENNQPEIFYSLAKLDKHALLQVRNFFSEYFRQPQSSRDLVAYIRVSDYEGIVNKVRLKVLDLLTQARKQV